MSTASPASSLDRQTRNAFNELLVMDGLSALPLPAVLRVLQTIPTAVLRQALEAQRTP